MAIHKRAAAQGNAEAFMNGAPDASDPKGIPKGHKRQVSITIAPELLRQVDERSEEMGLGRSAFVAMAVYQALQE